MRLILNDQEIKNLAVCGRILATALRKTASAVKPGISASSLNKIAEQEIRRQGAKPSFLNYGDETNPFPPSLCVSINDEVVHGIPGKDKIIREGDIVSLDLGAGYGGVYTDMARSVVAGKASPADIKLIRVAEEALNIGIGMATAGAMTGDIGSKIQQFVESNGYFVVKALVGHGIGLKPHQDPQVPNYGRAGEGDRLEAGMAIAIEPMVNIGTSDVRCAADGWTVKTYDGKRSAHAEHTVLITDGKPLIITAQKS